MFVVESQFDPALELYVLGFTLDIYRVMDRIGPGAALEAAEYCRHMAGSQTKPNSTLVEIPHFGQRTLTYARAVAEAHLVWLYDGEVELSNQLMEAAAYAFRVFRGEPPRDLEKYLSRE